MPLRLHPSPVLHTLAPCPFPCSSAANCLVLLGRRPALIAVLRDWAWAHPLRLQGATQAVQTAVHAAAQTAAAPFRPNIIGAAPFQSDSCDNGLLLLDDAGRCARAEPRRSCMGEWASGSRSESRQIAYELQHETWPCVSVVGCSRDVGGCAKFAFSRGVGLI
eukprot:2301639-Pleurochrysis_carterae.AAC.1